ncbi:zinc-dependent alcohol dehydrogenase family protein [Halorientalis brevis]|nr:zinc-dependent alcohol dehydrogenase family protein [Halorientalis brevis]
MKAAVFHGVEEPLQIEEVEPPTADDDQIVVETEACGICRSDWHAWKGDWDHMGVIPMDGLIFGHEPAGTVAEVGDDVERFREGDSVTVPFCLGDGTCEHCRSGHANVCERLMPLGFIKPAPGAFAERFPVREADFNVVKQPDSVDPVEIAGLGCRFATAFHGLVHRVDLTAGDWVAVHGLGGVGLSAVHVANALGANVIGVDIIDEKLDKAEELGADETLNANDVKDVPQAVKQFTESSKGVDIAVDALGVPETCQNAFNSLGKTGQHLQIGMTEGEDGGHIPIPMDNLVYDEREIVGSYGIPPNQYDEIFRMMDRGKIDPGKIVTETVSLEEVPDVIESMGDYDTVGIPVCNEF